MAEKIKKKEKWIFIVSLMILLAFFTQLFNFPNKLAIICTFLICIIYCIVQKKVLFGTREVLLLITMLLYIWFSGRRNFTGISIVVLLVLFQMTARYLENSSGNSEIMIQRLWLLLGVFVLGYTIHAALNAKIRNKSTLLFGDNGISSKVSRAGLVKNYLGLPSVSGDELRKAFSEHIKQMGITITDTHIDGIYSMGNYFVLCSHGKMYEAKTVILAVGSKVANPLPGEKDLLGNGISYCATCDGAVYTGKTVAVVTYSESQEDDVLYLAEMAQKVIFLPQYDSNLFCKNIETVAGKPASIEQTGSGICLRLVNGESIMADGVFLLRETLSPADLLPGLDMEGSSIKVDRLMQTNIAGCFAAGDCVGAPFQYLKAAGEGNIAAHSAVSYLAKLERSEIPS